MVLYFSVAGQFMALIHFGDVLIFHCRLGKCHWEDIRKVLQRVSS